MPTRIGGILPPSVFFVLRWQDAPDTLLVQVVEIRSDFILGHVTTKRPTCESKNDFLTDCQIGEVRNHIRVVSGPDRCGRPLIQERPFDLEPADANSGAAIGLFHRRRRDFPSPYVGANLGDRLAGSVDEREIREVVLVDPGVELKCLVDIVFQFKGLKELCLGRDACSSVLLDAEPHYDWAFFRCETNGVGVPIDSGCCDRDGVPAGNRHRARRLPVIDHAFAAASTDDVVLVVNDVSTTSDTCHLFNTDVGNLSCWLCRFSGEQGMAQTFFGRIHVLHQQLIGNDERLCRRIKTLVNLVFVDVFTRIEDPLVQAQEVFHGVAVLASVQPTQSRGDDRGILLRQLKHLPHEHRAFG